MVRAKVGDLRVPTNGPFWSCKENVNIVSVKLGDTKPGKLVQKILRLQEGQGIAEYTIMLAVILVVLMGAVRLIGANAGNIFSQVGSAVQ